MFLVLFKNITTEGIVLNHVYNSKTKRPDNLNGKIISKEDNWCLTCASEDVPVSLQCRCLDHTIYYEFDGFTGKIIKAKGKRS